MQRSTELLRHAVTDSFRPYGSYGLRRPAQTVLKPVGNTLVGRTRSPYNLLTEAVITAFYELLSHFVLYGRATNRHPLRRTVGRAEDDLASAARVASWLFITDQSGLGSLCQPVTHRQANAMGAPSSGGDRIDNIRY